jgi:Membrane protein involved in colicin uptake
LTLINDIVGITKEAIALLNSRNTKTVEEFLSWIATSSNLEELVRICGSVSMVESWIAQVDLMVLPGITPVMASNLVREGWNREKIVNLSLKMRQPITDITGMKALELNSAIKAHSSVPMYTPNGPEVISIEEAAYRGRTPDRVSLKEINETEKIQTLFPEVEVKKVLETESVSETNAESKQNPKSASASRSKFESRRLETLSQYKRYRDRRTKMDRLVRYGESEAGDEIALPIENVRFELRGPLNTIRTVEGREVYIPSLTDVDIEIMIIDAEFKLERYKSGSSDAGKETTEALIYALKEESAHRKCMHSEEPLEYLLSLVRNSVTEYNSVIPQAADLDNNNYRGIRNRVIETLREVLSELAYRGYYVIADSDTDGYAGNDLSPFTGSSLTIEALEESLKKAKVDDEYILTDISGTFLYDKVGTDRPLRNANVMFRWEGSSSKENTSTTDQEGAFTGIIPKNLIVSSLKMVISKAGISQEVSYTMNELRLVKGKLGNIILKKDFAKVEGLLERVDNLSDDMMDVADNESERIQEPPKVIFGDGDNKFALAAGTSSSNYSYKILHRLVEPDIVKMVDGNLVYIDRKGITEPINVSRYRENMACDPLAHPMMASLGIGYILTMQQEWKPTHFSLGDLLYSVALAPGEEHRIIMTERKENYTIADGETLSALDSESYTSSQSDDTDAVYANAMHEEMTGSTHMESKTKGSGTGLMASLFASSNKVTTTGHSESQQDSSRDETTAMAEKFNESIARQAENQRRSNRTGIRTASSSESTSVTSKIIANHNHSHALTMQYWEVVRNYLITTRISDVRLVCYVPFKPIPFLPKEQSLILDFNDALKKKTFGRGFMSLFKDHEVDHVKQLFYSRYQQVLKYYDSIFYHVPSKYRGGLNLMKKYATYPEWEFEGTVGNNPTNLRLRISGGFLSFHSISAYLVLKNGVRIHGRRSNIKEKEQHECKSRYALVQYLKEEMENTDTNLVFEFQVPPGVRDDDYNRLELDMNYSSPVHYTLHLDEEEKERREPYLNVLERFEKVVSKKKKVSYRYTGPENLRNPDVYLDKAELSSLSNPRITSVKLSKTGKKGTVYVESSYDEVLKSTLKYPIYDRMPTMSFEELQRIETAFQHITENTILYSQAVWREVSPEERAMMLERFTVGIPNAKSTDVGAFVPLMNCVSNQIEGFYGNCMIMNFTYPPEVAKQLDTSTKKVQDSLFRYHTEAFRAPETAISLSTKGMIGEAVLGGSNASEKVDLTRFWNWQDSPIDHADDINAADLRSSSLLEGVEAPDDLLSLEQKLALGNIPITRLPKILEYLAKEKRGFEDLTNAENVAKHMTAVMEATTNERINVLTQAASVVDEALGIAEAKVNEAATEEKAGEAERKAKTKREEDDAYAREKDRLAAENKDIISEESKIRAEQAIKNERDRETARVKAAEALVTTKKDELAVAETTVTKAKKELAEAKTGLANAEGALVTAKAKEDEMKGLAEKEGADDAAKEAMASAMTESATADAELTAAKVVVALREKKVEDAEAAVAKLKEEIVDAEAEVRGLIADAKKREEAAAKAATAAAGAATGKANNEKKEGA